MKKETVLTTIKRRVQKGRVLLRSRHDFVNYDSMSPEEQYAEETYARAIMNLEEAGKKLEFEKGTKISGHRSHLKQLLGRYHEAKHLWSQNLAMTP